MHVSVVIPAYNEEKYLGRALDSLTRQDTKLPFEVIVVDNNSTDKTAAVAQKFASRLNLKVIKETRPGRGAARAAGFAHARGEMILSTDADSEVPPDWIERLTNILISEAKVVTGPCSFSDITGWKGKFLNWFQPVFMRAYRLIFGKYVLCGFNFGIRRQAYLKSGGFNKDFNAIEDLDLSNRVSRFTEIGYLPDNRVSASGRRFKSGIIDSMFSYVTTYAKYFILKKRSAVIVDPR